MSQDARTIEIDGETFELRHSTGTSEFAAWHGDTRVSLAAYRDRGEQRLFPHTETLPAWGGRGLAGAVVRYALDSTVAEGLTIVPACSFVAGFVREHDDWDEHVSRR